MKKFTVIFFITIFLTVFSTHPAFSGSKDHTGHSGADMNQAGMKGQAEHEMEHSGHMGENIHESTLDGYQLAYHLIDMKKQMEGMQGMKGMKHMDAMKNMSMTHHLMVYIQAPDGHQIEDAKIGYLVKGPDGSEQKAMTMGMKGGFGADVDLTAKGTYTINTKALANGKKLMDSFTYEVK